MKDKLTIIVPIFNEEENLPAFFLEMDTFLLNCPITAKILLVNDGSTDSSPALIKDKCGQAGQYEALFLDGNYGLSTAIKAGIDHCATTLIGYIDADLQTHPDDFLSYLEFFPEYDMVNGIRQNRQDSLIKKPITANDGWIIVTDWYCTK